MSISRESTKQYLMIAKLKMIVDSCLAKYCQDHNVDPKSVFIMPERSIPGNNDMNLEKNCLCFSIHRFNSDLLAISVTFFVIPLFDYVVAYESNTFDEILEFIDEQLVQTEQLADKDFNAIYQTSNRDLN